MITMRDVQYSQPDINPRRVMPAVICEAIAAEREAIAAENKAIDHYTEYCLNDPGYDEAHAAYMKAYEHRKACTARLLDLQTQYHNGTLVEE